MRAGLRLAVVGLPGAVTGGGVTAQLTSRERRVLNPRPRRHHRRTYSLGEVRAGFVIGALLAAIAAWVAWRGRHPDPALFADPQTLLPAGTPVVARGALPAALAAPGWSEGPPARFTADTLYEKIDGRADFFLARGFRALTFVTLTGAGGASVDVELYDLGAPENALGALTGEKAPQTRAEQRNGSTAYIARNALFAARGAYYMRAIGSDESPVVRAQLEHALAALGAGLPAAQRPWAQALFEDGLGLAPDRVTFTKENAFSFGFARDVTAALLPDGETELFVAAAADPAAARALAARFEQGFLEYGEPERRGDATWVKDRYLGSYARVASVGALVVGVRGAAQRDAARAALEGLQAAVAALPADVAARSTSSMAGASDDPSTGGGPRHE